MKKIIYIALSFLLVAYLSFKFIYQSPSNNEFAVSAIVSDYSITSDVSDSLIASDVSDSSIYSNTLVIDVRTKEEYQSGHLDVAINIHFTEIAKQIKNHTKNKNDKIMVYCATGIRSAIAKRILNFNGYKNVVNGGGYQELLDASK